MANILDLLKRRFPYEPPAPGAATAPPPGTYDPALDAALAASQRGYQDFSADTGTANARAFDDYELGKGNIVRTRDETLADLLRGHTRFGEDAGLQRQGIERGFGRTTEDFDTAVKGLDRQYGILAGQQTQRSRAMGGSAGVLAQALRKRQENQAIERQPLDVALARAGEDRRLSLEGVDRAVGREGEDYGTSTTRTTQAADRGLGELGLSYGRGVQDRSTSLERAGREQGYFGLDTAASRFYQAAQSGLWNPATPTTPDKKKKPPYSWSATSGGSLYQRGA